MGNSILSSLFLTSFWGSGKPIMSLPRDRPGACPFGEALGEALGEMIGPLACGLLPLSGLALLDPKPKSKLIPPPPPDGLTFLEP